MSFYYYTTLVAVTLLIVALYSWGRTLALNAELAIHNERLIEIAEEAQDQTQRALNHLAIVEEFVPAPERDRLEEVLRRQLRVVE